MGVIKIEGKSVTLDDAIIDAGIAAIKAALSVDFPDVENADIEIIGSRAPGVVRSATVVKRGTGKGMPDLVDLRGVAGGRREARIVRTPSAAIKALRAGLAATSAGDNGALNIWTDDTGAYRCESMKFMVTLESRVFNKQSSVVKWFKQWWARIQ
jgi:hypothetical protein